MPVTNTGNLPESELLNIPNSDQRHCSDMSLSLAQMPSTLTFSQSMFSHPPIGTGRPITNRAQNHEMDTLHGQFARGLDINRQDFIPRQPSPWNTAAQIGYPYRPPAARHPQQPITNNDRIPFNQYRPSQSNGLIVSHSQPFIRPMSSTVMSPALASPIDSTLTRSETTHHSPPSVHEISRNLDDSDSDSDGAPQTHPNKFAVEIENHDSRACCYKRQPARSGMKVKQLTQNVYNPYTGLAEPEVQQKKYYQKDLVRVCRCGKYEQMDGAFMQGRNNDCNGYEIHYSQKCKWKAYDDFKTGKRVLIRLCKCYKP